MPDDGDEQMHSLLSTFEDCNLRKYCYDVGVFRQHETAMDKETLRDVEHRHLSKMWSRPGDAPTSLCPKCLLLAEMED